jgi:uncharacterized protein
MVEIPQALKDWFSDCPFALVAFSGGVDSSLVAWLAAACLGPERHLAVISASPSLKLSDLDEGKAFAARHGIRLQVVETQELHNPDYASNPANRCYFCKHTLYTELTDLAQQVAPCWILNGTNTDDFGDYRPGLQAASEFEVRSPLAECGFNKQAVRDLAMQAGLECWNKPAAPCLSSRIPYGQQVTVEKLRRIEAGEAWLQQKGFDICRVRHDGDSTARIEVEAERVSEASSLLEELEPAFQNMGFKNVDLDSEGFASGKLNRVLGK